MLVLVIVALTMASVHAGLTPTSGFNYTGCGLSVRAAPSKQSRIRGGTDTTTEEFPWQITSLYGGALCGGTLITESCVVTAGHCLNDKMLNGGYRVYAGLTDRKSRKAPGVQTRIVEKVASWYVSKSKDPIYNLRHDIAILTLTQPFNITASVNPACLPTPGYSYIGDQAVATGHGRLCGGPTCKTSRFLQKTTTTIADCHKRENEICIEAQHTGTGRGDSGGPLVVLGPDNKYSLVGVTSYGKGMRNHFQRVTWYMDYIKEHCQTT